MIRLGSSTTFAALISYRCDMALIEPMRRNKPNITYLLTYFDELPPKFSRIW